VELEQLLAVDLEYRDALSVFPMERRIERHVDLSQLERMLRANALHDLARVVAEVAAGLAVERHQRHETDAATLSSWTTSS
jgi:hypothetical protein